METLSEALERLEERGFEKTFRAGREGLLEIAGQAAIAPESLVVEEVVRFEGETDPEDQAVLFALRSPEGRIRGTFVTSYGTQLDPYSAAAIQRLDMGPTQVPPGPRPLSKTAGTTDE